MCQKLYSMFNNPNAQRLTTQKRIKSTLNNPNTIFKNPKSTFNNPNAQNLTTQKIIITPDTRHANNKKEKKITAFQVKTSREGERSLALSTLTTRVGVALSTHTHTHTQRDGLWVLFSFFTVRRSSFLFFSFPFNVI